MMRAVALILLLAAVLPMTARRDAWAQAPTPPWETVRTNEQGAGFQPAGTLAQWEARKKLLRRRILTACGLAPLWERTPLKPQVYGRIERDGYTIEKVVLETLPGFY